MIGEHTDEELSTAEERDRENALKFRATKKIRVVSGGTIADFDDLEEANSYQLKQAKRFGHTSLNIICPNLIRI